MPCTGSHACLSSPWPHFDPVFRKGLTSEEMQQRQALKTADGSWVHTILKANVALPRTRMWAEDEYNPTTDAVPVCRLCLALAGFPWLKCPRASFVAPGEVMA